MEKRRPNGLDVEKTMPGIASSFGGRKKNCIKKRVICTELDNFRGRNQGAWNKHKHWEERTTLHFKKGEGGLLKENITISGGTGKKSHAYNNATKRVALTCFLGFRPPEKVGCYDSTGKKRRVKNFFRRREYFRKGGFEGK